MYRSLRAHSWVHLVRRITATQTSHKTSASCACRQVGCIDHRKWLLSHPDTIVKQVTPARSDKSFLVIHDDLLHPVLGGNKVRKLDALLPHLSEKGTTDLVTCGGLQSAHTAAVAAACAERGIAAHLLIRGERPKVPTGYHLLARMFGHVSYVSRSEYKDRTAMLQKYTVDLLALKPDAKVHVLAEGAAEPLALLGVIRLVRYLAQSGHLSAAQPCSIIVDSGTGTTATGLAIGIALLQLPWQVVGVMLAGQQSYYEQQAAALSSAFLDTFGNTADHDLLSQLPLQWVERTVPRRFGQVDGEDIAACSQIAKQHGILLDPIYSLSAWEVAGRLLHGLSVNGLSQHSGTVAMLHTGGALGLQGLAQRFPEHF